MMNPVRPLWVAALLVAAPLTLSVSPPALAHHSAAMFDQASTIAFEGTVTRFEWANPHVYLFIEVRDATGAAVEWEFEADSTAIMIRDGWTAETLEAGDPVSIRAHPGRDAGAHHAQLVSLVTEGGQLFTRRSSAQNAAAATPASSIEGVWDALRNNDPQRFTIGALTERGAAAQAAYNDADYPAANCIPYAVPHIIALAPYRNQIDIQEDRVVITSEFFNVERIIHMDGRGHPENGVRTNQGHSISIWEGDVLVVDTALFEDDPAGHMRGIPSGAQKHTVERYYLSEDRRQLIIDYVVEDPEHLATPTTGRSVWDYAPDGEMLPFGCTTENASFFFRN